MKVEAERENFYQLNWLDIFMVGHKGFIAGGCFKNIFNGQKVKDLDIFFENQRDFDEAILYYDEISGENGDQEFRFYYENENVKAYKHQSGITIELCQKVFGTPKEIISNFDFTICKFAYYKKNEENSLGYAILYDDKFFEHLQLHRLVTDDKILYPMSTFERMIRYIKYGYYPCKETKLKIAKAIHDLSDQQIEVGENLYDGMD